MPNTIPLNTGSWDLVLDPAGNLSLTDPDSSIAQDVASAIRTFIGEAWYDTTLGLPYFQSIFGQRPPASLVTDKIKQAAFTVADVATVNVTSLALTNRVLTGIVLITSTFNPTPITVNF